jgi:GDPmannose 4,6-dehydratase
MAASEIGMSIEFTGDGVEEQGIVSKVDAEKTNAVLGQSNHIAALAVKPGDVIVKIDPRYFRPTEVETLLGDAGKAKAKLGWEPVISFEELVREMAYEDLLLAAKDRVIDLAGFAVHKPQE